jgi:energy-converting hydrogenase Eha subunit G
MRSRLVEVLVVVGADADEQRHLLDDVEAELAQLLTLSELLVSRRIFSTPRSARMPPAAA